MKNISTLPYFGQMQIVLSDGRKSCVYKRSGWTVDFPDGQKRTRCIYTSPSGKEHLVTREKYEELVINETIIQVN